MIDLFDSKGRFAPLDEATLSALPEPLRRAYDAVKEASEACTAAERAVTDISAQLHQTVRDLRVAEHQLQKAAKPSFMDVWKRDLAGV